MTWNDHDHRGEYAEERHDHDIDYAALHHRHYDDESTARGLREDLGRAEERIRELEDAARQWRQDAEGRIRALEDDLRGVLAFIRVLDRLRPTCVICRDATADRQTVNGPACTDCVGDLPDDGPDPDRPETWAFTKAQGDQAERAYIERRVIQAAVAGGPAAGQDLARTVAAARQEWRAASEGERAGLMRAAEEAVNAWRGAQSTEDYQRGM